MSTRPSRTRLVLRLAAIAGVVAAALARTLPRALALRVFRGREAARAHLHRALVRTLQALGPTFVKFGQIAAMRADALPADLCRELGRLHDGVAPMSRADMQHALAAAVAVNPTLERVVVDPEPAAGGSIACVYRGILPDGELVALKLKRPGIDARMRADLALLEAAARAGQRLPKLRGMPIADLVGYMSRAILGQLDFDREARHTERIRDALASFRDVRVPALRRELSAPNCLVFEYVPGLAAETPATLPPDVRSRLAGTALAAVHALFFGEGLVHCDLHPGNLYLSPDRRVVLLDAGYCVELPVRVRAAIGKFFERLAAGDGRRCGEIVLDAAVDPPATAKADAFVTELAALVAGAGDDFDMSAFGNSVYDLQQRYGIYAASDFAFPLTALLVVQGTVRAFSPDVDFRGVGVADAQDRGSSTRVRARTFSAADRREREPRMTLTIDPDPTLAEYEAVVTAFRARAFVAGDLSAIDDSLTDDFVDHFAPEHDPPGKAGVRRRFKQAADGFQTVRVEVVHSMRKGNVLMQAIRIHMRHVGAFMGMPATGAEFWIPGFDAFELRDGKIAGHWGAYDVSRIPDVLGLSAPPDAPETANSWSSMWSSTAR